MSLIDNKMLWSQFGASIDSLYNAIHDCPDDLWEEQLWPDEPDQWVAKGFSSFWYLAYHTLFWLDLYLSGSEDGFHPPAPFDLVEMRDNETLPRVYKREELLSYLGACYEKCQNIINDLNQKEALKICSFPWGELPYGELMLYNLRHVQEHAAHLHMFLGQNKIQSKN
jgi:hypothetical protein